MEPATSIAAQVDQARQLAQQAAFEQQMQTYLESGDPILMQEAIAWIKARSPNRVNFCQTNSVSHQHHKPYWHKLPVENDSAD